MEYEMGNATPSRRAPKTPLTGTVTVFIALALVTWGCHGNTTTSATSTTTTSTTTETPALTTETFDATVPVGGATFYSFSVGAQGTVSVTLLSVGGQFVPSTVMMGLAIGTPSGTSCSVTSNTTVQAGSTAQVTAAHDPGLYCANVADIGNLFAPAAVSISVQHP
jgi:hypothetical protein